MSKSLLIVEECLRDLKAHWFEYIRTITTAAELENWKVDVVCHQNTSPEIQQAFSTFPIFQYARYLDNAEKKLPGERYYGFILHSWRCLKVLFPFLNQHPQYDHIFVPTVLVHHLLAWWVIMTFHPQKPKHLTLFFVTNPGVWDTQTKTSYLPQSAQLQGILIKLFRPFVQQETVTLAVETKVARQEFEALTTLPFIQLPHPVANVDLIVETVDYKNSLLNFACFGFARYEKGSDLFKQAIEQFIYQFKSDHLQFYIQWIEPFDLPDGTVCNPNSLSDLAQVKVIDRPLVTDAYQALLKTTDCMVLPYRNSSYYARVSRIAIESTFLGIPMIYTKGGWLEDLVQEFGAGIGIEDENIDELIAAIQTMSNSYSHYRQAALIQQEKTRVYFSGQAFCQMLLEAV